MIRDTKGHALLQGARGTPAADIGALADALVVLSRFAHWHRDTLDSVEINPLLALPAAQGVLALDAVLAGHSADQGTQGNRKPPSHAVS